MNKTEFILNLRATASEIKPLTEARSAEARVWNGTEYAKGEARTADPYALAWWSILRTMADMLEAQESLINQKQIVYMEGVLFGGMGSLNDLYFEPKSLGVLAATVNERLRKSRVDLYTSFKRTS